MLIDIMTYASGELINVMSMDLTYFEQTAPVITTIVEVFIALGWALLIGNIVFQALKSMVSGIGFESEDPKIMFCRSFVFAFLLLCSRQICELAMAMTGKVIDILQIPSSLDIVTPDEGMFTLAASARWLLVIIVGVILMVQMVKLLFEIGERYVVTGVLTFFAPLAFAMGGSKNTTDIFKGWCRMYGSMMLMMIMNIVFIKLILSAMSRMTSGSVLVWLVFVVALTRVARKIDGHITKIGLNPAITGDGIGGRIPGVMTAIAVRSMSSLISKNIGPAVRTGGSRGRTAHRSEGRRTNPFGNTHSGGSAGNTQNYSAHTSNQSNGTQQNSQTAGGVRQHSDAGGHPNLGTHINMGARQNADNTNIPDNKNSSARPPISRNTGRNSPSQSQNHNNDTKMSSSNQGAVGGTTGRRPNTAGSPLPRNRGVMDREAGRTTVNEGNTGFSDASNTSVGGANYQNQRHSAENKTVNKNQRNFRTDNHNNSNGANPSYREQNSSEHTQNRTDNAYYTASGGYSGNEIGGEARKSNPAAANRKNVKQLYRKQNHEYPANNGRKNKQKKWGDDHRKEK